MQQFKTIDDIDIAGKRVLIRADLNVPMQDGKILDTARLDRLSPSLDELIHKKAKVILISHLGRPEGKHHLGLSLAPVGHALSIISNHPIRFINDCVGPEVEQAVSHMHAGDIVLLENLRFYPGEEANDPQFAEQLAKLADVYINDGFSVSHRAHASVCAITKFLPAIAGRMLQAELTALENGVNKAKAPILALVGGAKVSTKLGVLEHLVSKVDILVLGGGIANTFLCTQGHSIGLSLCEHAMMDVVRRVLEQAAETNCKIVLPLDVTVAPNIEASAQVRTCSLEDVQADEMILDIGPASIANIKGLIDQCQTIVWNGPLGVFEKIPFDRGTIAIAKAVAEATKQGKLFSLAGGGETVAALTHAQCLDDLSYVSAAGGAFLEWLEGVSLPGIEALKGEGV